MSSSAPFSPLRPYTVSPSEGRAYPNSGRLMGWLVDALGIRGHLLDGSVDCDPATVARCLDGNRVEVVNRDRVARALGELLAVPNADSLEEMVETRFVQLVQGWDSLVGQMSAFAHPFEYDAHQVRAVGRLVAFELGIRLGAWRLYAAHSGGADVDFGAWSEPNTMGNHLKEVQRRHGWTNEEAADVAGVTARTWKRWKSGQVRPGDAALGKIAAATSPKTKHVEWRSLRLKSAVDWMRGELDRTIGEEWRRDLIAGAHRMMELTLEFLSTEGPNVTDLREMVLEGSRCRAGRAVIEHVASGLWDRNDQVAADLWSLVYGWGDRLQMLAVDMAEPERLARHGMNVPSTMNYIIDEQHRIRSFDSRTDFSCLPSFQYSSAHRMHRAMLARIARDWSRALRHLELAVSLAPQNGLYRFKLGAMLGEYMSASGRVDLVEEAVEHCRQAFLLNPGGLFNALNEVGIILSNARLHEDAERAFAEAAGPCAEFAHHYYTRAMNLLALGRWEDALGGFERTLALAPSHRDAAVRLCAVLSKLGRAGEAAEVARALVRSGLRDPRDDPDHFLDPWSPRS